VRDNGCNEDFMPWTNNNDPRNGGKNGGPWKPGNPSPWGQTPNPQAPNFEELLQRGQDKIRQWLPGGGMGGRSLIALALVGVFLWLLSGAYTVGPNEVGLNKIFGRYTGKTASGLNYNLPFPIGSVLKLPVTDRIPVNIGFILRPDGRSQSGQISYPQPAESLMLTGDENGGTIADVKFTVFWQIDPVHPEDYAFNIAHQKEAVRAVAESSMREIIGHSQIQRILTADRKVIEPAVQELMQKILNRYQAGILILQVQLQSVGPPDQVIAAFRDVTAAQQDQDRMRNEAEAYANQIVPEARGKAAAIIQEAEGYREQTVAEAKGQAARFSQIYEQYKKAPEVTRERIYLETMERVLGGADKIVVDEGNGQSVVPYLPLPQLTAKPEGARK
jgi:membrane protease subunit HflK